MLMKKTPFLEAGFDIRETFWSETIAQLNHTYDGLGLGIDPNILETVAGCIVHGFTTRQSCGGHLELKKLRYPWIDIIAPNEPKIEFIHEREALLRAANRSGVHPDKLFQSDIGDDAFWKELALLNPDYERTPEYDQWLNECAIAQGDLAVFLEIYQKESPPFPLPMPFITDGSLATVPRNEINSLARQPLSKIDARQITRRIQESQASMERFGSWMKERFFRQGAFR